MAHESFQRDDPIGSSNRSFGLVFAAASAILGLRPLSYGYSPRIWWLVSAAIFLAAAFVFPAILAPLNRLWMKVGLLMHRVTSPIVLGILFFGVVTPTGGLMRLLGMDPMRRQWDPDVKSYWIDRAPSGARPESFVDQF